MINIGFKCQKFFSVSNFTKDQITKLAKLAHLTLDVNKMDNHMAKLNDIFDMLQQLRKVDTSGVLPLYNVSYDSSIGLRTREDVVLSTPGAEIILQNAAKSSCGYFSVPKVLS